MVIGMDMLDAIQASVRRRMSKDDDEMAGWVLGLTSLYMTKMISDKMTR